jgi:hypothetical protein
MTQPTARAVVDGPTSVRGFDWKQHRTDRPMKDRSWPRAAVPNVRRKRPSGKLRISVKGSFAAPAPIGSRRAISGRPID